MKNLMSYASCVLACTVALSCVVSVCCLADEATQVGVRSFMVPMRDAVRLSTDIYYPEIDSKPPLLRLPAVLLRTQYDKANPVAVEFGEHFARHGFLSVVQDWRGRYASEGEYGPLRDAEDGHDTIQWIADHDWCDGKVGMHGGSASGGTQFAAAALDPAALVTIIPLQGQTNAYHYLYRRGGARHLSMLHFLLVLAAQSPQAKDLPQAAQALTELTARENVGQFLELAYNLPWKPGRWPLSAFPAYENAVFEFFFKHHEYGDFWKTATLAPDIHLERQPSMPILWVASWCDWNLQGMTSLYERLVRAGYTDQYLVIGPWPHCLFSPSAGDVNFGIKTRDLFDEDSFLKLQVDWFKRWLKDDRSVDLGPRVRYFLMGGGDGRRGEGDRLNHGGEWRTSDSWPPPAVQDIRYYLHEGGRLSPSPPREASSVTRYRYDPNWTVSTIGKGWVPVGPVPANDEFMPGPRDQIEIETLPGHCIPGRRITDRSDVVTFQTEPLPHDVKVVGSIEVSLWIASDAPDTDFFVRLVDSYPNSQDYPEGYGFPISEGHLRARFRDGFERPTLMEQGKKYRLRFSLEPTANLFQAGHRIQIFIFSSNFPMFDVNRNTADLDSKDRHIAVNEVFHQADNASYIQLSVVDE